MASHIGRRKFLATLGGAAAWPLAARAQQERMRRVGVLLPAAADDVVFQTRMAAFLQALANGGLIPTSSAAAVRHRDLIITLAARHKLPAVYWDRFFVAAGGLMSYGPDLVDQFGQAAGYVDRILKGEKPGNLPVQASTKYQLAINLKAAKAIGLTVPDSLLARADEVIE
jgi:ABC-type uncharacterized transport system substrate-binding protein